MPLPNPLTPYLLAIKVFFAAVLVATVFWAGFKTASVRCALALEKANTAAQEQAITDSTAADAAAAKREQGKLIQQAALSAARRAIQEAKTDACIDTDVPDAVANSLWPESAPR